MSTEPLPPQNSEFLPHTDPPPQGVSFFQLAMTAFPIVAISFLVIQFVGDAGSWYFAAAQEHNLQRDRDDKNGELAQAIKSIDAAISADPTNLQYLQQRSLWRRDAGDYAGAIADLDLIDARIPSGDEGFQARISVLMLRGLVYQRQGKHAEAVGEQTQMIERLKKRYHGVESLESYQQAMSLALNNRAYFRAIANVEKPDRADLEGALHDIDQSLKLAGYEDGGGRPSRLDDEAVKRDTRGYLRYLLGDYRGALADMERALLVAENAYAVERTQIMEESRSIVDRRPIDLHMRGFEENLAVLYHHRGLIYDKIGRKYDAQVDFDRAKRLGYNPARGVF